uniref:MD-2-related lipid-recognition domain-containing protein n=1 Tax=viral metagenome TaxID=1070528 RepID=A0A6C0H022_9ZZZZ
MLLFILVNLLTLIQSNSIISQFIVKDCGNSNDLAHNLLLDIEPKLPQTDYKLFLNMDLSSDVTSGTSKYNILYNGFPVTPTINDLCTEMSSGSNISCPLTIGHISSESKGTVPTGLSGKVQITNEWFVNNGSRILCMEFTIKIA